MRGGGILWGRRPALRLAAAKTSPPFRRFLIANGIKRGGEAPYTISHYKLSFLGGGQRPLGAGRRCEGAPARRAGAAIPSSH
jgi:hypothetical protein